VNAASLEPHSYDKTSAMEMRPTRVIAEDAMTAVTASAAAKPLSIEMVLPSLAPAGMEVMACELARALAARGHRVGVTCLHEEGQLGALLHQDGMRVSVVPCQGIVPNFRTAPALRDHFRRLAPQLVHVHSGVWPKTALAARAAGVPHVLHTAHNGFPHGEPWFYRALYWWGARHSDLVVAVSPSLRDFLVNCARIPEQRIITVVNGVDDARFAPGPRSGVLRRRFGIPDDTLLIGCVARFRPVKNHALLIDAVARVRATLPNVRLVLVGDGPLRTEMEEQAQRLGLADAVIFAGTVMDPTPVYRDLDAFALTSVSEGTSISILEALASGTPVIATAVGNNPMLLAHGACGELVPSGNVDALASALHRVLTDPDYRASMAKAAREHVLEVFSLSAMIDAYERLYRQICNEPRL
jgi:glycosyltransferase involved in cell wall biosynthesis